MEATHTYKEGGRKLQFVQWINSNEMEMKDENGLTLRYTEVEVIPIFTKKWFVEIFTKNRKTNLWSRLDIIEPGYNTQEEAQIACNDCILEQQIDNSRLIDEYNERMKRFVMDETTEDTEPTLFQYNYKHSIRKYLYSPFHGFKSIIEEGEEEKEAINV